MFAAKRMDKLKEILLQYKQVEISSLSSVFSVSEATVRRDLDKLELEGFIKRTHGGAVLIEDKIEAAPETITKSNISNLEEKKMISEIASNMIENNSVIILGSGTTCFQLACNLKEKDNLTIVTNNVLIGTELSSHKNLKVILTGGDIYHTESSISLVGDFANKMLNDIHVDKAFLSVDGVDINAGFTSNHTELSLIWNNLIKVAEEVIILADYSKFGKRGFIKLGPIHSASKIITNNEIDEKYKQYFFEQGIPLFTSYHVEN